MKQKLFLFLAVTAFSFSALHAEKYFVTPDADDSGDGSSWTNAMTLAAALANSALVEGDEIFVKEGTYTASSNASFSCNKTVSVYGNCKGTENEATIVPPDYSALNLATDIQTYLKGNGRRVLLINGAGTFCGFNISGGDASSDSETRGGGVYINNKAGIVGKIQYCVISNNVSINTQSASTKTGLGGGIYVKAGGIVENCIIENNVATANTTAVGQGGGVLLENGSLINCIVRNNKAMSNVASTKTGHNGGGVSCTSSGTIINCLIVENATGNSEEADNTNANNGGGIHTTNTTTITNSTIVGNTASGNGGGIAGKSITIRNCIIYSNTAAQNPSMNLTGTNTVKYSLWPEAEAGTDDNNVNGNPAFVDAAAGNYQLTTDSPAWNTGDNTANSLTTDLLGGQRIVGGNIDMGAYEVVYYTVTLPETEGAVLNPATLENAVNKGEDFSFTLTLNAAYDESTPTVTTNRPADGELNGGAGTGGIYNYTITNIESDITVVINGIVANPTRSITFTPDAITGLTISPEGEGTSVVSGEDFVFTLMLDAEYDESIIEVKVSRDGGATNNDLTADAAGKYTIADVRSDILVNIDGVTLNPEYIVTLPAAITGLALTPVTTSETIRSGGNYVFTLALDADYDESVLIVEATMEGGQPETLTIEAGEYTIKNIRSNVTLSITGVTLNPEYTVTLPVETTGISIVPTTAENKVRGGHDFEFSFTLDADYDQSTPVVEISRDGGATKTTITPDTNGKYLVSEVRSDVDVTISGIVLNPTGINYTNADGFSIYVNANSLWIEADGRIAKIYALDGTEVANKMLSGKTEFVLSSGVYVVNVNGKSMKIIIK